MSFVVVVVAVTALYFVRTVLQRRVAGRQAEWPWNGLDIEHGPTGDGCGVRSQPAQSLWPATGW